MRRLKSEESGEYCGSCLVQRRRAACGAPPNPLIGKWKLTTPTGAPNRFYAGCPTSMVFTATSQTMTAGGKSGTENITYIYSDTATYPTAVLCGRGIPRSTPSTSFLVRIGCGARHGGRVYVSERIISLPRSTNANNFDAFDHVAFLHAVHHAEPVADGRKHGVIAIQAEVID